MALWCLIPTERRAMGLLLGSTLRTAVWWYCWTFDTCRKLWHKSKYPSAWWASSTLLEVVCVPTSVTLSGFRRSLRGLLSWRSPLPQDPNTSGMGGRSLSYIRRPPSKRIMLLRPSASLRPPSHLVRRLFSSRRLMVWSSCFQNLFPTYRWDLLMEKVEQWRVHCQGWSYVPLKRLW